MVTKKQPVKPARHHVAVFMPRELQARIKAAAALAGEGVSVWIVRILTEQLKKERTP